MLDLPEITPNRTLAQLQQVFIVDRGMLFRKSTNECLKEATIDGVVFHSHDLVYLMENPSLLPFKKLKSGQPTLPEIQAKFTLRRRTANAMKSAQQLRTNNDFDELALRPEDVYELYELDDSVVGFPIMTTKVTPVHGKMQIGTLRVIRILALMAPIKEQLRVEELELALTNIKDAAAVALVGK